MQFTKIFLASFLASLAASAPLAAPQNDAPPFRVQNPSVDPIYAEASVGHDDRNFVFHIPHSAAGKICTPYLGATDSAETGIVKLFTLVDHDAADVNTVAQLPLDQHVFTFGLFEDGTTPTIQSFGAFSFPCVPGTAIGYRFDGAGSTLNLSNGEGRFVISTTWPEHH